jgi:hypothetical protein
MITIKLLGFNGRQKVAFRNFFYRLPFGDVQGAVCRGRGARSWLCYSGCGPHTKTDVFFCCNSSETQEAVLRQADGAVPAGFDNLREQVEKIPKAIKKVAQIKADMQECRELLLRIRAAASKLPPA